MSSKSKRNPHLGRPLPQHLLDQREAAAAENWAQYEQLIARGARDRRLTRDEAPLIYQRLLAAFDQACDEARDRYEQAVPRSQWVEDRRRWFTCDHLKSGPAPSHWNPCAPESLLCTACWRTTEQLHCWLCGRHDHKLTDISAVSQCLATTAHTAVCDDCYPEGADAPKVNR
jgi:hypothetical protein